MILPFAIESPSHLRESKFETAHVLIRLQSIVYFPSSTEDYESIQVTAFSP
ncbi:uncharacterized protein METZ01_LOCUS305780 [marine metagenome]|uniref:Uncharacterized protein n=1 Tax=marine metagenome TaxID=408172 RepID=A0A382MVX3_9ZZZZ